MSFSMYVQHSMTWNGILTGNDMLNMSSPVRIPPLDCPLLAVP